jgi:hypothetical protein
LTDQSVSCSAYPNQARSIFFAIDVDDPCVCVYRIIWVLLYYTQAGPLYRRRDNADTIRWRRGRSHDMILLPMETNALGFYLGNSSVGGLETSPSTMETHAKHARWKPETDPIALFLFSADIGAKHARIRSSTCHANESLIPARKPRILWIISWSSYTDTARRARVSSPGRVLVVLAAFSPTRMWVLVARNRRIGLPGRLPPPTYVVRRHGMIDGEGPPNQTNRTRAG